MTQLNTTRYLLAALAVFIFTFVFDYVVHGNLLLPLYNETPDLWRTAEDMQANFHWALMSQAFMALVITFLFTRNYEGKGTQEGVRFGFYVGLVLAAPQIGMVAWMPISPTLAFLWAAAAIIYGIGTGVVAALVYRKG
jgi:hypothetical protein